MRFVGFKDSKILMVTDSKLNHDNMSWLEFLDDSIAVEDLMINYKIVNNQVVLKNQKRNLSDMKLAFVGNWKMKCGISTYSEKLMPHIVDQFSDFRFFIEENKFQTEKTNIIGGKSYSEDKFIECWKRGESLINLIDEIKKYNPDIILIQHEFGLWSNARYWLSFMNQISEYKTFITMHSVFYHKDKTICEAAMPNIIVHLNEAKDVLKNIKKISGNVSVIPHGFDVVSPNKLWNFYKTEKTFMQFGFGFRYKGWEKAIKTTYILKQKYDDVFFTGLFSESPFNMFDHQKYYEELMSLIKELNLQENVAIIRGYQSDECLESYLKTNTATIFPYTSHPDHEVFGASGAARMAISSGTPVITSTVNHFLDLPSIKCDSPEEIANELSKIFESKDYKNKQIAKQIDFANKNQWKECAEKYIQIFKS